MSLEFKYDPKIGRFLSPDPLLEMFPDQTPYQYAFNSPLIWKDPSGLKSEKERGDKIMEMENCIKLSEGIYTISREIVCTAYRYIDINEIIPVNSTGRTGIFCLQGAGGDSPPKKKMPNISFSSFESVEGQSFLGFSLPKADNPMQSAMKAGIDNGTGYSSKTMITSKADKNISVRNGLSISIALSALALNGEMAAGEIALSATTALSSTVALPVCLFAGYVVYNIIESSKYPKSKVDQIFNCHTGPANPMFDPDDDNFKKSEKTNKGLINQIKNHIKKLNDYIKDPLNHDNLGHLKKAIEEGDFERARSIYDKRIRNLEDQIRHFIKQLNK